MSTKKSELYATLYACWNDLIITNRRQPTPNQLIKKFYSWHPKKDKFKKDDLEKAIVFMKKIGLIPLGNSGHTV